MFMINALPLVEGFHMTSSPRIVTASAMLDFFPLSFYVLYYTEKYPTWPPWSSQPAQ